MLTRPFDDTREYTSRQVYEGLNISRRAFYRYVRPYIERCRVVIRQQFFSGKALNEFTQTKRFRDRFEENYAPEKVS